MKTEICDNLNDLRERVFQAIEELRQREKSRQAIPFLRGHSTSRHQLQTSLHRHTQRNSGYAMHEEDLYWEFASRSAAIRKGETDWDLLLLMRHNGMPTRILDWTESFSVALFFATDSETQGDDDVIDLWLLNPYRLNRLTVGVSGILDPASDLPGYLSYFKDAAPWFPQPAAALYPPRNIPRISAQSGLFTLHGTSAPLEQTHIGQECLQRFQLPRGRAEVLDFLEKNEVNPFSIYGDLDNLSRFLRKRFEQRCRKLISVVGGNFQALHLNPLQVVLVTQEDDACSYEGRSLRLGNGQASPAWKTLREGLLCLEKRHLWSQLRASGPVQKLLLGGLCDAMVVINSEESLQEIAWGAYFSKPILLSSGSMPKIGALKNLSESLNLAHSDFFGSPLDWAEMERRLSSTTAEVVGGDDVMSKLESLPISWPDFPAWHRLDGLRGWLRTWTNP